ncbi:MAG: glycosyltransferase family 4 protein [Firmicutes bacterium]|nr:glycosyltransferase family 4 protein [Bacillota bacterium]
MRILSITAQKPHSTGSGTYLTEIVNALDRLGHTQAVVAGVYSDDTASFPEAVGFFPVYFDESFRIYGMSDVMPYPSSLYSSMSEDELARFESAFEEQIRAAVEAIDPDVIYCHHLFILTAMVKRLYPERCVIGQCHGSDLRQFRTSTELQKRVLEGISKLDGICALHEEQKADICKCFGVSEDKVLVIGSGYNNSLFNTEGRSERKRGNELTLVFAGKISKPKGVAELIEAIRLLNADETVPAFNVRFAGGCQDYDVLHELNLLIDEIETSSGSCTSVEYLGQIKQARLAAEFKSGDVFVLPSYFEGLGLVLIEAMASGMLPVANRLPGIKEWIDESIPGSNALYVEMPEMESIDKPLDSEKEAYIGRLAEKIKLAFENCEDGFDQPDCSGITWDAIADKLLCYAEEIAE